MRGGLVLHLRMFFEGRSEVICQSLPIRGGCQKMAVVEGVVFLGGDQRRGFGVGRTIGEVFFVGARRAVGCMLS